MGRFDHPSPPRTDRPLRPWRRARGQRDFGDVQIASSRGPSTCGIKACESGKENGQEKKTNMTSLQRLFHSVTTKNQQLISDIFEKRLSWIGFSIVFSSAVLFQLYFRYFSLHFRSYQVFPRQCCVFLEFSVLLSSGQELLVFSEFPSFA